MFQIDTIHKSSLGLVALLLALMLGAAACTAEPIGVADPEVAPVEAEVVAVEPVAGEEVVAENSIGEEGPASIGVLNGGEKLIRATRLLDYDFRNVDGEVTGDIENILIDIATGEILFITIEYGGFLDLGDTRLAMPLNAFAWGLDNELILNIEEERLQEFPDLGEAWPNLEDNLWDDEVNQFWVNAGITPGVVVQEENPQVMYLREFLDREIGDIGFGDADIYDVLIDLEQSQGRYVIADYGVDLFNNNLIAIPFSAFFGRVIDDQLFFTEDVNQEFMQAAPVLDRDGFDGVDLFQRDFDSDLATFWEDAGYPVGYEIER